MTEHKSVICVLSANETSVDHICSLLTSIGNYECVVATTVDQIKRYKQQHQLVFALVDRSLDEPRLRALSRLRERHELVTFGAPASQSKPLTLVESLARFQLSHPLERADLERAIKHLNNRTTAASRNAATQSARLYRGLVGESEAVTALRILVRKIAACKSTVLIGGETGTGKEIVARNIHYYSQQYAGPFVPVNCSAIPPDLLESELFGHKKGAFTGALSDREGRFVIASGGTLFLDEIGDMTPELQAKLLRVLEDRIVYRVGCNKPIAITARLVAATHRDLEQGIKDGSFREDLYYRLNVLPVSVPPLRERKEDIEQLVSELSGRLEREQGMSVQITPEALSILHQHAWPGNVRELANLVERLAATCASGTADVSDMPARYRKCLDAQGEIQEYDPDVLSHTLTAQILPKHGIDLRRVLKSTEATLIRQALDHTGGTVTQAAELLGVRRTTLVEKVKRLGLEASVGPMVEQRQ